MRARLASWGWWIGVPVIMGIFAWLPYWILNIAGGQARWWRVPIMTSGLFDTYTYLFWIGASVQERGYEYNISFFHWILKGLWHITSPWVSIPELWILSRGLSLVFILWVGAWAIYKWSGLDVWRSRLIALALWLSLIMTLGLRPGIYTWYLPFCLAGLGAVFMAWEQAKANRLVLAGAWSLAALLLTSTYPWFFVVACIWLGSLFVTRFLSTHRSWFLGSLILIPCLLIPVSLWLAGWFLAPAQAGLLGLYERTGIVFSHAPFLSNTVGVMVGWIGVLFVLARTRPGDVSFQKNLFFNSSAWLSLLVAWFNTPFTGFFFYPDHFIIVVAVLGWFSLASILKTLSTYPELVPLKRRFDRYLLWSILLGSAAFFFYVLQQPLRFNIDRFYSYIIHLVVWLVLAVAAGRILWRTRYVEIPHQRLLGSFLLAISTLLGLGGVTVLIVGDAPFIPQLSTHIPAITWLRTQIPSSDSICSDQQTATFFSAHTGLVIRPAEATFISYESRAQVQETLEAIVTVYRPTEEGKQRAYLYTLEHFLAMPCTYRDQYTKSWFYRPVLRLLRQDTPAEFNTFFGCREDIIEPLRSGVLSAMNSDRAEPARIYNTCQWIVVPDAEKSDWHLPTGYTPRWNGGGMTIYRASDSLSTGFVSQ